MAVLVKLLADKTSVRAVCEDAVYVFVYSAFTDRSVFAEIFSYDFENPPGPTHSYLRIRIALLQHQACSHPFSSHHARICSAYQFLDNEGFGYARFGRLVIPGCWQHEYFGSRFRCIGMQPTTSFQHRFFTFCALVVPTTEKQNGKSHHRPAGPENWIVVTKMTRTLLIGVGQDLL